MSNLFAKQFSLESENANDAVIQDAGTEVIDGELVNEEVTQVTAEMQELENAIDTSEDAAKALEQVQEFIEEKQEAGGLTEGEAQLAQVATEALLSRFGGHVSVRFASLESFGAEGGRATATSYTLEGIGETIRNIWNAIKKWFKKWWDKLTEWFSANVSSSGRLEKAGKALAEAAGKKSGKVINETLEDCTGSFHQYLVANPSDKNPTAHINVLKQLATSMFNEKSDTQIKEEGKKAISALKAINFDDIKKHSAATPVPGIQNFLNDISVTNAEIKKLATSSVNSGKGMLGGAGIEFKGASVAQGAEDHLISITASISIVEQKWEDGVDLKALSKSQIEEVGRNIQAIGFACRSASKVMTKEKGNDTKELAELDKIVEKFEKLSDVEQAAVQKVSAPFKSALRAVPKLQAAYSKSQQLRVVLSTRIAASWLAYGRRSLANIGNE